MFLSDTLLVLSTVPLRKLDSGLLPEDFACGVIVFFRGQQYFLTVQHATSDLNGLGIELEYVPSLNRTKLYKLTAVSFPRNPNFPQYSNEEFIDFAYCQIPNNIESYFQKITQEGQILYSEKRLAYSIDNEIVFSKEKEYAFGAILYSDLEVNRYTTGKIDPIRNMAYLGMGNEYVYFSFDSREYRDEDFKGTSGAPIIDFEGNLAAVVVGGDIGYQFVYGIPIQPYKHLLVT